MSHQALYRKWRPITFDDVVGQQHITAALKAQVQTGRLSHAYLFTGTRGTGKTTCAKILARAANCLSPVDGNPCNQCENCRAVLEDAAMDVSEIDAASNNGVDNIREIREEVNYAPTALRLRTYIIDEVHMLSPGAFNALLKTLEEPPEHALFILATTEIHKVPATILSRCQRYDFRRISPAAIGDRLLTIARAENLSLSPEAALLLARLGDGSMRDAISLLDRCVAGDTPIDLHHVQSCLGVAENQQLLSLFSALCKKDAAQALTVFSQCYDQGRDMISLFDELLSLIRDIYLIQSVKNADSTLTGSFFTIEELKQAASEASPEFLDFAAGVIGETLSRLTRSAIRRADGEMCLLRLCRGPVLFSPAPQQSAPAVPVPPVSAPAAPAAPAAPSAAPKGESSKGKGSSSPGDTEARDRFFAALKGTPMNPAAAAYIRLAHYSLKGELLVIGVDEEGLLLLDRPRVVTLLEQAAHKAGFSSVRLRSKSAAPAQEEGALDEVLDTARSLGVDVREQQD